MKTILIVDDDAEIRNLLADILRDEGYGTVCCEDGLKALEAVDQADVDLIISDINMPTLTGMELVMVLSRHPKTANTPVVALTGLPQLRRSTDERFTAVLHKPLDIDELVDTIERLA